MDRREFFRRSFKKATDTAVQHVDEKVREKAQHWIRPPFAINEIEFILACTRCDACIEACPHQTIFPLASRLGAGVVNTPALDLLNKGCHLCEDWPCVNACEPNALVLPEVEQSATIEPPVIARAEIDTTTCLPFSGPECGACVPLCPVEGALVLEREKPVIKHDICVGCGLCREACIIEPKAIKITSIASHSAD